MRAHKVSLHDVIGYFILIPFLNPRGFYDVVPGYKPLMTAWMYGALLLILFEVLTQYKGYIRYVKKSEMAVCIYFLAMILITVIAQGGLHEGLQNMIATPCLCIYGMFTLRRDPKRLLRMISNILLVLMILNLTIFNPYIMQYKIAEYHIIFLGHVQVAGQYGALGVLCGCLEYAQGKHQKKKAVCLLALSIITMLTSGTASAMLVVALAVLCGILYYLKLYEVFCRGTGAYVILFAILGAGLVMINSSLPGFIIGTLNSRHQIWHVVMETAKQAPIIGYGIQGVTLKMYWGGELNYAHSQFAQNLLDGGILLSVLFYIMTFLVAREVRATRRKGFRVVGTLVLIAYMCISLFESVSFYPYYCLTLVLLMYLPEIAEDLCKGQGKLAKVNGKHEVINHEL